jgi:hypothetical protein
MSGWSKKPVIQNRKCSVVFTWQLPLALKLIKENKVDKVGGPAVKLLPGLIPEPYREVDNDNNWLILHNPFATRTSIGCVRKCEFCAVPKVEPEFREILTFTPSPIVCDNNFLACSKKHIIRSIDRLKLVVNVDFNQGLDARLFKDWHIDEFKKLKWKRIRFSWDFADQEKAVLDGLSKLKRAGFPEYKLSCYVLVGYKETPEEALYRCKTLKSLGVFPFPIRYQPLNALIKNSYCSPHWNRKLLYRFVKFWARYLHRNFTFEEWLDYTYED